MIMSLIMLNFIYITGIDDDFNHGSLSMYSYKKSQTEFSRCIICMNLLSVHTSSATLWNAWLTSFLERGLTLWLLKWTWKSKVVSQSGKEDTQHVQNVDMADETMNFTYYRVTQKLMTHLEVLCICDKIFLQSLCVQLSNNLWNTTTKPAVCSGMQALLNASHAECKPCWMQAMLNATFGMASKCVISSYSSCIREHVSYCWHFQVVIVCAASSCDFIFRKKDL